VIRKLFITLGAAALLATPTFAAAPCKGPNGRFIKCPPAKPAAPKAKRCRNAKGQFAKCGTPGTHPA